MTAREKVADAELNALLDGELTGEARRAVEAQLSASPEDAERALALRQVNDTIRARYDPVLDEPVPASLAHAARMRARGGVAGVWRRVAAAVALLLIGGAAGFGLRGLLLEPVEQQVGFVGDALGAHIVYTPEVRHPVEVRAEEEHLVRWLTKRVGAEIRAPVLAARRFRLMGGRLLPHGDTAAAQFMYEDDRGRRLTLYVRQAGEADNTAFQFAAHDDLSAFYWIDQPLAYALIGELPRAELLSVARLSYEQLQ